ncbi:MAG: glycine zipper domain-containing protein [Phycisphaerales bacterium]
MIRPPSTLVMQARATRCKPKHHRPSPTEETTVHTNHSPTRSNSNARARNARRAALIATAAAATTLLGCNNALEGGASGAGLGALAGLGIGSLSGNAGEGAAIGAISGALLGGIIGDQNQRREADYPRSRW